MSKSTNGEACEDTSPKQEQWKPIPEYEGLYEVSDQGRVKSLERIVMRSNGRRIFIRERILKQGKTSGGYLMVGLYKKCRKTHMVQRLVVKAFLSDFKNELESDHKDGNKLNNFATNFRMATPTQNKCGFLSKAKGTSSQYRGVCWDKQMSKWRAKIRFKNRQIFIGLFISEQEAATAFNAKATELGFLPEALNSILN
jgi:hypothetical protein